MELWSIRFCLSASICGVHYYPSGIWLVIPSNGIRVVWLIIVLSEVRKENLLITMLMAIYR
jgi:hypothetical protein